MQPQAQRVGGLVGEHAGQQGLVVAAQVGARGAGAQHAVPAGGVVDQVAQRLRHGRARVLGDERASCRPVRPASSARRTERSVMR